MIGPEHETARASQGEGFGDSVTFSFADPDARLYGMARLGLTPAAGHASALALLFDGSEPVAAVAAGGVDAPPGAWEDVELEGVRARTVEPLATWTISAEGDGGDFDLGFEALTPPLELNPGGVAGGLEGYEQLCRVTGSVAGGGTRREISCLGQRGHNWGVVDWQRISLARTVSAWMDERHGVALSAVRPTGANSHGDEAIRAVLIDTVDDDTVAVEVGEPRLSTTYDGEGRQRRAGLELWLDGDDELPRRAAGEVACGTSLELGALTLDCAFFTWRMEGRSGAGRYDVLRRR